MKNVVFDNLSAFSERLKYERLHGKYGKLSMEVLAQKIGSSRQTIAKWEKGEGDGPTVFDLLMLCEVFGCDFGYLVGEYDCRTRQATDIKQETCLSEEAINELRSGSYQLYGDDIVALLSSLIVDSDFFFALTDVLCAEEWSKKTEWEPFFANSLKEHWITGKAQEQERRDAVAFYLQEAQTNFRKAAEKALAK